MGIYIYIMCTLAALVEFYIYMSNTRSVGVLLVEQISCP